MTLSLAVVALFIAVLALWSRLREAREQLRITQAQRDAYARDYEMLLFVSQLPAGRPDEKTGS